jgi:hypothetical protein
MNTHRLKVEHRAGKQEHTQNASRRLIAAEIEVAASAFGVAIPFSHAEDDSDDEHLWDDDGEVSENCECRACCQRLSFHDRDTLTPVVNRWKAQIVTDGSLPNTGFELPTAPASGDLWCRQIEEITAALGTMRARVTGACGCHIHVDARDCSYWDIRRVMRLYARVESALFELVPPSRRENRYCLPCGDVFRDILRQQDRSKDVKKAIQSQLYQWEPAQVTKRTSEEITAREKQLRDYGHNEYAIQERLAQFSGKNIVRDRGDQWRQFKEEKYGSSRYNACNIHSWIYRGSLEWRVPSGTVDATKIIAWGRLWATLIDFAVKTGETALKTLCETLNARDLLLHVTPKDLRHFVTARWAQYGDEYVTDSDYNESEGV